MIRAAKELPATAKEEALLTLLPKKLFRKAEVANVVLTGMEEREGVLTAAKTASARAAETSKDILCMFEAYGELYGGGEGWIRAFSVGGDYGTEGNLRDGCAFSSEEGGESACFLTENKLYIMTGRLVYAVENAGGEHLAAFGERLYRSAGTHLYYCAPFSAKVWDVSDQRAGDLPLTGDYGNIVGLAPCPGKLYVFREKGIFALTGVADDLDFALARVDFDGEEILEGSVRALGDKAVFFTKRGGYVVENSTVKPLENLPPFVPCTPFLSAASAGKYACSVLADGGKKLLIADPEGGTCYLLSEEADALSGGSVFRFARGTDVFCLTEENAATERTLRFTLDGRGGVRKSVTGALISGEGDFTLTVSGDRAEVQVSLPANKRVRLPRAVWDSRAGVRLSAKPPFAVNAVTLLGRREK